MSVPRVPDRSSLRIDPTLLGAIAYVGGAVTGACVLALERESRFVRFHAAQSIVFSLTVMVLVLLLRSLPLVGWMLAAAGITVATLVWIFLMAQALLGRVWHLPYAGQAIEDQIR